jgi:hypothetical protein
MQPTGRRKEKAMETSPEKPSKPKAKPAAKPKKGKPSITEVEAGLKDEDLQDVTGGAGWDVRRT